MLIQAAEMVTGGVTVCSTRPGEQGVYARSVIQPDGDVITVFSTQALDRKDFASLKQQHLDEISSVLDSLESFSDFLGWLKQFCFALGGLWTGLSGLVLAKDLSWATLADLMPPVLVLAVGGVSRRVCLRIVRWKAGRLIEASTSEAERGYSAQTRPEAGLV
jgi:hypothetical protein